MNKWMQNWMMNCEEATRAIVQREEEELTFREKVQLKMHLVSCKFCRMFNVQNKILSENISQLQKKPDASLNEQLFDPGLKESLQQKIQNELNQNKRN